MTFGTTLCKSFTSPEERERERERKREREKESKRASDIGTGDVRASEKCFVDKVR